MIYSKSKPNYVLVENDVDSDNIDDSKSSNKDQSPLSNQLYFYSDVTRESIYLFNRQLSDLEKQLRYIQINFELKDPPPIKLYISSEGGEVFSCFSAIDRIKSCKIPVDTYVEGIAASCATLLSVVGRKRYMNRNSVMLIHSVSSGLWGNYQQFQDEKQNLDLIMKFIKNIYLNHTKFQEKELDKLLKHDLYLSPEECIKFGLADYII